MGKINESSTCARLRNTIGSSIREFRLAKKYSQEDLADLMGISRSTISKIENGSFSISIDYLERFSMCLNFKIHLKTNNL